MFFFFFFEKIKKHVKHSLDASEGMKSTLSKYKCPYVLKVFPSSRQWYGWVRTFCVAIRSATQKWKMRRAE